jgi:hypothetical protein
LLAPVDNPPVVNAGRVGRAYAIKWQLKDASGNFISALSAVFSLRYYGVSCAIFSGALTDTLEATATGGSGLHYDAATGQYIFNWSTPATVGCYIFAVELADGTEHRAHFNLR